MERVNMFSYEHSIVLIDDDIDDHEIFNNSVHEFNHHVKNFLSARRALRYLNQLHREDHPSIIVTDYEMPEMNGMTLLQSVKESPLLYHIPVIVYSATMNIVLENKLKENGAAACFVKSNHLNDLKEFLFVLGVIFENSVFD